MCVTLFGRADASVRSPEGAFLGGAWHPDSPKSTDRLTALRRIGVPGSLTGSAMKIGRAEGATSSVIGYPLSRRAHLPMALPEVATPDFVRDPATSGLQCESSRNCQKWHARSSRPRGSMQPGRLRYKGSRVRIDSPISMRPCPHGATRGCPV